jgi:hypothetical protein
MELYNYFATALSVTLGVSLGITIFLVVLFFVGNLLNLMPKKK